MAVEKTGSKTQSFGCPDPNVGFYGLENGCTQGSFLKQMHARVFLCTDARNQKGHFDGCTQQTFGQRIDEVSSRMHDSSPISR